MRTGAEYLASLNDGRVVLIDGEKVNDVTSHPAFEPVAHTVAELFDLAADPAQNMQYVAPETGATANRTFSIPRSAEELRARREAIQTWARHTHGWIGRSPDHVGTFLASFAAHPEIFSDGARDFSANVTTAHRRLLAENLYLSYAIIPPRSRGQPPRQGGRANTCRSVCAARPKKASSFAAHRCSPPGPPSPMRSSSPASSR